MTKLSSQPFAKRQSTAMFKSLALLLLLCSPLYSPLANATAKIVSEWVPFTIKRNHIVVTATVKDTEIAAVVDTGATMTAIHNDLAKQLHLKTSGQKVEVAGVGKTQKLAISRKTAVTIPGLFTKRLPLLIYDTKMDSQFILGMDYLAHGVLQIDYIHSRLRLATPNSFKFPAQSAIPLTRKGHSYYLTVTIDDVPLQMILDTGNADSLFLPFEKVSHTVLYQKIKDTTMVNQTVGIDAAQLNLVAGISNHFKIGQFTLENVAYQIPLNANGVSAQDGILGYDVLKNFVVTIDLINNNLYLSEG